MLTGVGSHASMSEKSRMETLEKSVAALFRITKEQAEYIDELREACESLHSEIGDADQHLTEITAQLEAHYALLYRLPQFKKADSPSEEELSA